MAPIRIGLVGLSSITPGAGAYTAGTWGMVHLAAIIASPHYEIVALCNSSVEAAKKSVEFHKLGPNIKTYGSPEDLANDPDVDLVVISVFVGKHYQLAKPALLKKKNVFVEFPVAATIADATELVELAKTANLKTVTGAQAAGDPGFRKIKELIDSKAIGEVVVSSFVGQVPLVTSQGWPENLKKFLGDDTGIGRLDIGLGHALDMLINVLGDYKSVQSVFKTHGKTAPLLDHAGNIVDPAYKVTSPDTFLLQGVLESGAVSSVSIRTSSSTVDGKGFRWIISGSEGEIELTSSPGYVQSLQGVKVRLRKFDGEVQDIDLGLDSEPEHVKSVPPHVINTARVYEAFATGNTDGYSTFESGLAAQKVLDSMRKNAIWAP